VQIRILTVLKRRYYNNKKEADPYRFSLFFD
jgi:hypothetical protein